MFAWIRKAVRDAVLGGVADAVCVLREAEDVPALLLEHQGSSRALPEPEETSGKTPRRRAS